MCSQCYYHVFSVCDHVFSVLLPCVLPCVSVCYHVFQCEYHLCVTMCSQCVTMCSQCVTMCVTMCCVMRCWSLDVLQRLGVLNVGQKVEEQIQFERIYKNGKHACRTAVHPQ